MKNYIKDYVFGLRVIAVIIVIYLLLLVFLDVKFPGREVITVGNIGPILGGLPLIIVGFLSVKYSLAIRFKGELTTKLSALKQINLLVTWIFSPGSLDSLKSGSEVVAKSVWVRVLGILLFILGICSLIFGLNNLVSSIVG